MPRKLETSIKNNKNKSQFFRIRAIRYRTVICYNNAAYWIPCTLTCRGRKKMQKENNEGARVFLKTKQSINNKNYDYETIKQKNFKHVIRAYDTTVGYFWSRRYR